MIVIDDDRVFTLYYRQNRKTKWMYASYGGRYKTISEAINALNEHIKGFVEYYIEDIDGNDVLYGTICKKEF